MLQVRKSRSCGFFKVFFRDHYLEGSFTFQWGLPHGDIGLMRAGKGGGGLKKIIGWGAHPHAPSTLGHTEKSLSQTFKTHFK